MMHKKFRLLLLEESKEEAEHLIQVLKDCGYAFEFQRIQSKKALEAFSFKDWDLVLSNYILPEFHGLDALRLIREKDPELPFIFLSKTMDEESAADAIKLGANDYVIKGNTKRLSETIARELARLNPKEYTLPKKKDLKNNEGRFQNAFNYSGIGITLTKVNGRFLDINASFAFMLGYTVLELYEKCVQDLIDDEFLPSFEDLTDQLLEHQAHSQQIELRLKHKSEHLLWATLNISLVHPPKESRQSAYFIMQFQDSTEKKLFEEQLIYLNSHDPLTGLMNRKSFIHFIEEKIEKSAEPFSLLLIYFEPLDVFSSYGYVFSDQLIYILAKRLQKELFYGEEQRLSYFGEHTFFASFDYLEDRQFSFFEETLQKLLMKPLLIKNIPFYLSATFGVSHYPQQGKDFNSLVKKANVSFLQKKEKLEQKFGLKREKEAYLIESFKKKNLITLMHEALLKKEFFLLYQPKISPKGRAYCNLEALVRWKRKDKVILPEQFIPTAEESGLILPLGQEVLSESCFFHTFLQHKGYISKHAQLSVNLSARQFEDDNLLDLIEYILLLSGMSPSCLELEITEGTLMQNIEESKKKIEEMWKLGLKIAIDDFGTGYCSLSYLKDFKAHRLKIDKSFIDTCLFDKNSHSIILFIISLAHRLGLEVTSEGIETKAQYDFLLKHHCDEFQGYYFSQPLRKNELKTYLRGL